MNDQRDLTLILKSRFPLVVIETHEEERVFALMEKICNLESWALFGWSVVEGLRRTGIGSRMAMTNELRECLKHIEATQQNGVYVLFDAHKFIDDPINVRLVKQIAQGYGKTARTLVFISHELEMPEEIRRFGARFEMAVPNMDGLRKILKEEVELWQKQQGETARGLQETLDALLRCLHGLPQDDVRRLIRQALQDDGVISAADVARVGRLKMDMVGAEGVLTLEPETARLEDVAGLAKLKRWLELRRKPFLDVEKASGLDAPKGVLMLGVQGSGKSLAAKATAGAWSVPLVRLDFASLYNKYHGETERNLRQALKTAEAMAPCVLWIDEIEKGLAADSSDDGLSRRVLGTLLTWMAERESRVFLVATANDVSALPPELLRKGRFDEIFFVDLPDDETRKEIFAIHLRRRKLDPQQFDTNALVKVSEGFAGAEIEQAIVAAHYEAHSSNKPIDTQVIADEIARTRPLSVIMAERVRVLRDWARDRTVPAG
jgi:SpoVK/Ycf46/Vps4 family AAA+-type ATPase